MIVPLETWYPAMAAKWTGTPVPWSDRTHFVHHHTVGGASADPLGYARQVADQHWAQWGVPGGYAVLVGTDGVIREMSGLDRLGVHAGTHEWNRRGVGIAYQGDFRFRPPSDVMLDAARTLIAERPLDQTYHRAVRPSPTTCPGDALIRLLPLELDMPLTDEDLERIKQIILTIDMPDQDDGVGRRGWTHGLKQAWGYSIKAATDAAVARKLIERMAPGSSVSITEADIEAIAVEVADEIRERLLD